MKNTIKLLILFSFTFLASQTTKAQVTAGVGLAYGSKIDHTGININGQFFITENIALAPSFTYYFPNTVDVLVGYNRKWYEINVDANYYPNLNIIDGKLKPYGLAGANYSIISFPEYYYGYYTSSSEYNKSRFGINVGAGAEFDIEKMIIPFAQLKYTIGFGSYSQAQIAAGIRFKF